ncbi:hypothetical protein K8O68_12785 [Salipaludibacillus sp. CUR1]|uniref:hypothetical protein n=1 Tax=Salipaludibacillus sp. CUR1 TaxID=2820003 RepID=UPI001E3A94D8|nr:hypothetical protein [Salipaludibacillus sp. CUR1]MCE7793296.1 hypothetical protein [Salipaludibacillus sp. CUR1]
MKSSLNGLLLEGEENEKPEFQDGDTCSGEEESNCTFSKKETEDKEMELFGFNITDYSLLMTTLLIGAIDGFNPCSLWALMFLISMIVRLNSRKIILAAGLTFVGTVSFIYGMFILGTFAIVVNIIDYFWIRVLLFIIASAFAAVNIKEGVMKGPAQFTFSISGSNKKQFIKLIREKMIFSGKIGPLIMASILIGTFASLIELPCTAGFPVIWNGIMSDQSVGTKTYVFYLIIYIAMYMLIEIAVVSGMVITMKKTFMTEETGKALKFISGTLMGYLAIVLLLGKSYMNDITLVGGGSLAVILLSLTVIYIRKLFRR